MDALSQPIPGLAWFDISDPASPELDKLAQRFGLHELQIEDCRHRPQRAKAEEYENYMFLVLKHLHKEKTTKIGFDDFDIFLGRDFLITVHVGDADVLQRIVQHASQQKQQGHRLDRILYILCDLIVDEYLALLDELAEQISDIETTVLQRPEPPTLREIFRLKRKLIDFRRVAAGMREVINAVIRREEGLVGDDLDPYFRNVYDHLVGTVDLIETYRDLLSGSLDIYLSAVANRTNEVMKVLTIYGTVALPLVIITGFFGMNLHLPWMNNVHGVWFAIGLMALSTIIVLWYFKRKRWF